MSGSLKSDYKFVKQGRRIYSVQIYEMKYILNTYDIIDLKLYLIRYSGTFFKFIYYFCTISLLLTNSKPHKLWQSLHRENDKECKKISNNQQGCKLDVL
jgi:hypothetical protein